MNDTFPARSLSTLGLALAAAWPCTAQCALQVAPGESVPGVTGAVYASQLWDPDGPGPQPAQLVVGGDFAVAGDAVARGLAAYDLTTGQWSGFGPGPDLRVQAIAQLATGELAVAGLRLGVSSTNVLRWNGSAWSPLGGAFGLTGQVGIDALATLPNGDLFACGNFTAVGGAPRQNVARWDGSAWQALGTGLDTEAMALAVLPNGDVVAGGTFATAGGIASPFAARWDGTTWQPMSAGLSAWVTALHVRPNGELVAASGNDVLRWNGSSWVSLGGSLGFPAYVFAETASGLLLAGGDTQGGVRAWNGTAWSVFTTPTGRIQRAMTALPNGHLIVGGTFGPWLRRWTGANWQALGVGIQTVIALAATRDGGVVAGGYGIPGQLGESVARWNGTSWQPLPGVGAGLVSAIAETPTGGVMAAVFSSQYAARLWNGSAWTFAPGGTGITCFATAADGRLFGGKTDGVAMWDGYTWAPLVSGFAGDVARVVVLPDGTLVVAGLLDFGSGPADRIARWDGQAWTVLADVWAGALAVVHGELVVGGAFSSIGGVAAQNVARWDGATWHAYAAGVGLMVRALVPLPDGDLVAAHSYFTGALSRWDGATWTPLVVADGAITAAVLATDGLFVGGSFALLNGQPNVGYGRLVTPCPATIAAAGAGCAGSGGNNQLAVSSPWLGSTLRSETTGLIPNSIALAVWGLAPIASPLPALLSVGLPGCTLWVSPDLLGASVPAISTAVHVLAVPDSPSLVGQSLWHQVVALEFTFGGSLAAASSSNALRLTLGAF